MKKNPENKQPKARVLAYYLPQYHPIPENDAWWGKGFTEWTNVGKARPLFPGHYQPHVPADLGYYDLRCPEVREAQAAMARECGIEGFIYWHYWFGNGKQLLERPFNEVLACGKPDFPFALAWANESWSGRFHGLSEGKSLIEQTYPGRDDMINHFNALLPAFRDKRYITCEGKPMFFVYCPFKHPEMQSFISVWRELASKSGIKDMYFVAILSNISNENDIKDMYASLKDTGFDAVNIVSIYREVKELRYRIIRKVFNKVLHLIPDIRPYGLDQMQCPFAEKDDVIPTVVPNWDTTPRSGKRGIVLWGSTPNKFQQCVRHFIGRISHKAFDNRFLIVKSWNEWAEGNYLEPDSKYGTGFLEALKKEIL